MDFDILLYWMTHLGGGSWGNFRKSVRELAPDSSNSSELCRRLRVHFSELGYADFFINESQQWKIRTPILAGLVERPNLALLCGGRNPKIIEKIQQHALDNDCQVSIASSSTTPSQIEIKGSEVALKSLASSIGIKFIPEFAKVLSASLVSIEQQLSESGEESIPRNWSVRSFDYRQRQWVDGDLLPNTVREYSTGYGQNRYFVADSTNKLIPLPKHESIYAAAMLQCFPLAEYNPDLHTLSVPYTAPLPDRFARIACLSSGKPSRYQDGCFVYEHLPPNIAALLLIGIGQPFPSMKWSK